MLTIDQNYYLWTTLIILATFLQPGLSSAGDSNPVFHQCLYPCYLSQCNLTQAWPYIVPNSKPFKPCNLSFIESVVKWNCEDECKYHCMWKTVDVFREVGVKVHQFFGKWPQIRIFGAQEPASAIFSLLNLVFLLKMLRKFLVSVQPASPIYKFWLFYAIAGINTWVWSTVFHISDTRFTEKMDYCSAIAFVGSFFITSLARITYGVLHKWLRCILLFCALQYILSYVYFLVFIAGVQYHSHMNVSVCIGVLTIICWVFGLPVNKFWSNDEEHVSFLGIQCVTLYIGFAAVLEIFDFPAILYLFDAHSLWHAATIPTYFPIFSFAINDCRNLYRIENRKKKIGEFGSLESLC